MFDSSDHEVDSLPESAFKIYEDGTLQKILGFRHEDLPVSLGILIDSSGSMYDKRAAVDGGVARSGEALQPRGPGFHRRLLLGSVSSTRTLPTTSPSCSKGPPYIKSSGGTAIYDVLVASADYLSKNAKHPKQVLLVITDGEDNASSATLDQAIRRIQDFARTGRTHCVGLLFGDDTKQGGVRRP